MLYLEKQWHSQHHDDVILELKSNSINGLSEVEVQRRISYYGTNIIPQKKTKSYFAIFLHQFKSPLIYLLIVAAVISLLVNEEKDSIVIVSVVLLNAVVGLIQEGKAEQSLASLRKLSQVKVVAIRNGVQCTIDSINIVPGDIIRLSPGDAVVADARIIESSALNTTESALTGESLPILKSNMTLQPETHLAERLNMIYAGTLISSGRALAVVVATGVNTELGKVSELATKTIQPKTQLEQRIEKFGKYLTLSAVVLFFLVVAIGISKGISLHHILMVAISQMVSMVPEGLPVAMTIALAVGVQRMAKKKTIVRQLPAVEILGSTSVICTDKTGTLTRNEMMVTSFFLNSLNDVINVSGYGYSPKGEFNKPININEHRLFFLACALCNDSSLIPPNESVKNWHISGDPTEGALLTFASKAGLNISDIQKEFKRSAEIPFDSQIKMMATEYIQTSTNKYFVFIKGAPEVILNFFENTEDKEKIDFHSKKMGSEALRVLAFGVAENSRLDSENIFKLKNNMRFLGLVGEFDPPREEVRDSISECKKAGIKIIMLTGDQKTTGMAIARHLGISEQDDIALQGDEIEKLNEDELLKKLNHVSVFARMHPSQKLKIVELLQKKNEVVAMTGDGVNDAPALMKANVGVAMGITGTEVAKEASKIVITDDNFSTIVAAVAEGRLVYQNIKKLLLFLFVTSIDELLILMLALLFGYPPPLAAVQILWINLVTEGALTINLIMEPFEGDEMQRPPLSPSEPLLDKTMLIRMPLLIITSVVITFGWFIFRHSQEIHQDIVQTETFTMLVICQWFNVLNCRSGHRSFLSGDIVKNPWLLGGLLAGVLLHGAVLYIPLMNSFFHTVPLRLDQLIIIFLLASVVLLSEEIRKFFIRKNVRPAQFTCR